MKLNKRSRFGSFVHALVLGALLMMPTSSIAKDPLKQIFGMMTTKTGSSVYESQSHNGMAFGTFSARFSMYQPKVINFQAPELSAGCGGIDFFAGSISLIKKEELVQMGRSIAAGAAVYTFNLAVESICPSCSQAMSWIQDKLDTFNDFVNSSCQDTVDALSEAHVGEGVAESLHDITNYKGWNEKLSSLADTKTDVHSNWLDFLRDRAPDSDPDKIKVDGFKGNFIWEAMGKANVDDWDFASGWDKEEVQELLMSLIGTQIVTVDDKGKLISKPKGPSVSVEDLLYNKKDDEISLLHCSTNQDKVDGRLPCTKLSEGSASKVKWEGIYPRALRLILGDSEVTGIASRILIKHDLTREQQSLVESAPVPLMTMLFVTGREPASQEAIGKLIAQQIAIGTINRLVNKLENMMKRVEFVNDASDETTEQLRQFVDKREAFLVQEGKRVQEKHAKELKLSVDIMNKYKALADSVRNQASLGN